MAEDWSVDVRKYSPDAVESVIDAIVRYCGISLQKRDSALVAFSDPTELSVVRENYLKRKLGLTNPDSELDAAIATVGDRMKADRTKNRVTVYYLLAEHFRKLSVFGAGEPTSTIGRVGASAAAAGAATAAAGAAMAATAPPQRSDERPVETLAAARAYATRQAAVAPPPRAGAMGWLPWLLLGLAVLGLLWWLMANRRPAVPVATEPPAATAPAIATMPAAPTASTVIAGLPASVFFDTDSSAIKPEGSQTIRAAAEAISKSGSRIALTGYTDRTGDLASNQELAKNRAVAVRDALVAAGIPAANIEMRPPVMVEIGASGPDADARRVQISAP